MMKIKDLIVGAIATSSLIFTGCNNTNTQENLKDCDDYVYTDSISKSHVYGYVTDGDGNALANVVVTTGKDTALTSEDGTYSFERCRAVNGRCVVKFENYEYFSVIRTANIEEGEARVDAILMPQDIKEGVTDITRFKNSQGATIKVGKMTVSIPANSLVYESDGSAFNGSVYASTYYLNPNSENFVKEMPGGDMSGVTENGKNVILLSYGMVEVTLKDSADRKLQLKDGAESTMSFPSPEGIAAHDQIPLWYFDEEKGTWIEEGVATKNGDVYTGNVKHFSWHNCDLPNLRADVCGRVTTKSGKPVAGVLVTISQTSAYTDSAGYYCAYVPDNTPFFVTVKSSDYANCPNCPIYYVDGLEARTKYTQDIVLPDMPCIHGKVSDLRGNIMRYTSIKANNSRLFANRYGKYTYYFSGNEPVSLSAQDDLLSGSSMLNGKLKSIRTKYEFNDPSEIDENLSYDFILSRPINVYGSVKGSNRYYLGKKINITAIVDGKEYTVKSSSWGYYSFKVNEETKKITAYVKAKDGYGIESNRESELIENNSYGYVYIPRLVVPTGVSVSGSVVNTCGPSKADVSVVIGRGRNKDVITTSTRSGYFRVNLPATIGGKVKVKINCQGKRITKKVDVDKTDIDLGTLEFCSGEKPEPDCIYALIGDRTIKFDTKKDLYTEMFQRKQKQQKSRAGVVSKYQAWYKNPNNKETLILEIVTVKFYHKRILKMYLVSDRFTAEKSSDHVEENLKEETYTFKTDCDIYANNIDDDSDEDDIYLYGSATIKNKKVEDNMNSNYVNQSNFVNKDTKLLVGKSKSTEFSTLTVDKDATKRLEDDLKKKGFKEKSTFRDDEHRIASIFVRDDAEALIHRNNDMTSDVTILTREGIGKEPLYHCWKVDFKNSSMKKKGSSVDYMWKNEADIVQLVMFGPIMGVEFTKTDISEQKCGCTTSAPAVAN